MITLMINNLPIIINKLNDRIAALHHAHKSIKTLKKQNKQSTLVNPLPHFKKKINAR